MTFSSPSADMMSVCKMANMFAEQTRHERMMVRPWLDQTLGVGDVLAKQHWTQGLAGHEHGARGPHGGSALRVLGPAMADIDAKRICHGVVKSRELMETARSAHLAQGVAKSLALTDRAGALVNGFAKSHALIDGRSRRAGAGLCDWLGKANREAARASTSLLAARASLASVGLMDPRATRGIHDINAGRSLGVAIVARVGAGGRMEALGQHYADAGWRYAGVANIHGVLPGGHPKLRDPITGFVATDRLNLYRQVGKLDALAMSGWPTGWRTPWAAGVTLSAARWLMDSTVGGASAWTNAHRETAALQRLARDTARFGPGRTGLDVMYGRGARDHIGVMRVHEELASLRAQARIADLLGARGDRNGDDEKAPDHGLFVPVDGDILDALGGEIVPAAAIEDAFVRTGTGLDAALIWLWANPGHWVTDLRMMWPEASVDQRNSLRRHGHQIAIANLGLVWAWMTGNPFPVVIAVLGLRPAWRALFDELSKQRSSQNQTSADAE